MDKQWIYFGAVSKLLLKKTIRLAQLNVPRQLMSPLRVGNQVFHSTNSNPPTGEPWVDKVKLGGLDQTFGGIGEPRGG